MFIRIVSAALWFVATWGVTGVIALALDLPRWPMVLPAVIVALSAWYLVGRAAAARPASRSPLDGAQLGARAATRLRGLTFRPSSDRPAA